MGRFTSTFRTWCTQYRAKSGDSRRIATKYIKILTRLKQLISEDNIVINVRYEIPRTIPTPMFIFTMSTPSKLDLVLLIKKFGVIKL